MLSEELQKTLQRAYDEAVRRRHEFVTLEHLLYALTFDRTAADALLNCGADVKKLGDDLEKFLESELEKIPEGAEPDPQYTLGFQFVIQVAIAHVRSSGKEEVTSANALAAIFRERESHATYFLEKQNVTRLDVVRYISHGVGRGQDAQSTAAGDTDDETRDGGDAEGGRPVKDPLEKFCVDLNERAQKNQIDPLIGRSKELERTIHILARRRKNNPIFVGDAGVGKTAIVEGLARRIVEGKTPEALKDRVVYSLDMGGLLAGTRFRGEFEERLKAVVEALKKKPGAILFIDEIHTIIGAGAASGGALDASNMVKPALASGELSVIGATTYKEYRSIFEKDHALARRFQKVEVGEPTEAEAVEILAGLKSRYEEYHRVQYASAALKAAVELSARHITDRFLPDKAIDVLDESGAEVKLRANLAADAERSTWPTVGLKDVEAMVARVAKVPPRTVRTDDRKRLQNLEGDLLKVIYGQEKAVSQVVRSIQLSRAGLGEPDKPVGSFLFAGPTGVGKTELARQLAASLGVEFLRFDMSEYMEKHTVSRLIGSPPGYVGFDQGGQLTEAIIRHPHCVLLLDEIEKAHEDLYNILLQVMDYATLTDNTGRKADFRQVILILTTNTGARESSSRAIGFGMDQAREKTERSGKAIDRAFAPEFRNRLTAVVQFNPLSPEQAGLIVDKMIAELGARLKPKRVQIELDGAARAYLVEKGYDSAMGARPIRRLIETEISHALSSEILFGKLARGGKVRISARDGALAFEY